MSLVCVIICFLIAGGPYGGGEGNGLLKALGASQTAQLSQMDTNPAPPPASSWQKINEHDLSGKQLDSVFQESCKCSDTLI